MQLFPSIFPCTDPGFDIGYDDGLLFVGESLRREYRWRAREDCTIVPVSFVGLNLAAEVLNANDDALTTLTVTPSVGTSEGVFEISLHPSLVTEALKSEAVRWRFRRFNADGSDRKTLIFANFRVS